jgi:hypothetical protein
VVTVMETVTDIAGGNDSYDDGEWQWRGEGVGDVMMMNITQQTI